MLEGLSNKAVGTIKWVWWFLKEELPQFLSNWRTVPRLMMVAYAYAFIEVITWFMALEAPNNAQAGLVSVVVGAGAAWFGLYCNSSKTSGTPPKVSKKKKVLNEEQIG